MPSVRLETRSSELSQQLTSQLLPEDDLTSVRTSVVVPAYDSWETLPQTLEALRSQVDRADRELILVESSGTHTSEDLERRWPWIRALTPTTRAFPAQAR